MHHRTLIALAADKAASTAPTEIRIFAAGKNETSKGTFVFDATAAEAVMASWKDQGNRLPFDYDHAMVEEGTRPQDRVAAGWFDLEVREGALWAVNIEWTAAAKAAIEAGEWRYLSPTFAAERDGGRIVELLNVALTNLPATKRMSPLTASRDLRTTSLGMSFSEIGEALHDALMRAFGRVGSHLCIYEVWDDAVVFEVEGDGEYQRVGYAIDDAGSVTFAGEPEPVKRQWVPAGQTKTTAAKAPQGEKTMKNVLVALGLAADATESAAVEAVTANKAVASELVALTGKTSVAEALAVVSAWKDNSEKAAAALSRLAEIEAEKEKADYEALFKLGKDEGKIVPANEAKVREKHTTSVALGAFLETAMPAVAAPARKSEVALGGKKFSDLSTIEKHRLANDDPDAYAALKAAEDKG